jgi:citrate synthase
MRYFKLSGMFADIRQAAEDLTGDPSNVDFALTALADSYALPGEAPFVIFAVGRLDGPRP